MAFKSTSWCWSDQCFGRICCFEKEFGHELRSIVKSAKAMICRCQASKKVPPKYNVISFDTSARIVRFEFEYGFCRCGCSLMKPNNGCVHGTRVAPSFRCVVLRAMEIKNKVLIVWQLRMFARFCVKIVSMRWVDDLFMVIFFGYFVAMFHDDELNAIIENFNNNFRINVCELIKRLGFSMKNENLCDFAGMDVPCDTDGVVVAGPKKVCGILAQFPYQHFRSCVNKTKQIGFVKGQLCVFIGKTIGGSKKDVVIDVFGEFHGCGYAKGFFWKVTFVVAQSSSFLALVASVVFGCHDFWCWLS